jgi:hypothetical protein
MDQAGEGGTDAGGTGTGDAAAAAALAAKAAADKVEADKAEAAKGQTSDAEAKLLKDLMKHKTRASELEGQLSQVNEKLKSFDGIDLDKVRTMLAEQEALETKRLEAKGDFDRLTKQMGERHAADKSSMQQQIEEAKLASVTLSRQIAELTVGGAFTNSQFVKEDLTLTPAKARVIYGSHFEFKDGKVVGYDKPAGASDRTLLVDAAANALSFEEAMRKLIEADPDRDELVKSKMKPGAGSSTVKSVKKDSSEAKAQMTSIERIAAGLKALAIK